MEKLIENVNRETERCTENLEINQIKEKEPEIMRKLTTIRETQETSESKMTNINASISESTDENQLKSLQKLTDDQLAEDDSGRFMKNLLEVKLQKTIKRNMSVAQKKLELAKEKESETKMLRNGAEI